MKTGNRTSPDQFIHPDQDYEAKKVLRLIKRPLTLVELAELGQMAGRLAGERDEADDKKKSATEELKAVLLTLDKGTKEENIECELRLFPPSRTAQVWNGDELLEERPMTESEFQIEMPSPMHGMVVDEDESPLTPEEERKDFVETMADEKKRTKPSLVDSR